MKVFISHSSKDAELAIKLKKLIKKSDKSIDVFCSSDKDIPIAKDFNEEIFQKIKEADVVIPLISENYHSSKYCMLELGMAATFVFCKTKEILPVSVFPLKPGDAMAETPIAFLECYDISDYEAIEYILDRIDPDSEITKNQIRAFSYKAKKDTALKAGIVRLANNYFTCAFGPDTYVKDWADFSRVDRDKDLNEFSVTYNLNPYKMDDPGKLDFISFVLMYQDNIDLYSFANYSKNARIEFEFVNYTHSVNKLRVEIKATNNEMIANPIEFDVSNDATICKIPLKDYKVELLKKVEQICFVVDPEDLNEDEGTFIIKEINIKL